MLPGIKKSKLETNIIPAPKLPSKKSKNQPKKKKKK